jgi:small subunit ribosomal protein S2
MTEKSGMPMKQELFLEAGVHIGTKIKTNDMKKFIFRRRDDGLYILDLRKSAERLIDAAKLMGKYNPSDVLVIASRVYSSNPASKFSSITGIPIVKGRFIPGTMTNMSYKGFKEPKLIFVCDPKGEREAVSEAAKNGVPIIALCDTDNETKFIDLIIPINNKGRRSLALIFYVIARELALSSGKIKSYEEFTHSIKDFEQAIESEEKEKTEETEPEKPKESVEKAQEDKDVATKEEEKKKEAPKEKKKSSKKEEKDASKD